MGVVVTEVDFENQAPDLSQIADKVAELSGLRVSVTESGADAKANLFDLHGYLGFACAPKTQVEVHAYRAGAVKEFCRDTFGDAHLPVARCVQGLHEPPGTQTVYVRGYLGQEPTLFFVTTLALEALGGKARHPIDEEVRREYGMTITPEQLQERQRKLARQMWPTVLVGLLLLPLLIPLWLIGFVVTMPWRIWKGYKAYRNYTEGRGGALTS
jgi:hypothetical protein